MRTVYSLKRDRSGGGRTVLHDLPKERILTERVLEAAISL